MSRASVLPPPSGENAVADRAASEPLARPAFSTLEAPWHPLEPVAAGPEAACTPWSNQERCTGEEEMLIDPWSAPPVVAPPASAAPAPVASSDPAEGRAPSSAPLALDDGTQDRATRPTVEPSPTAEDVTMRPVPVSEVWATAGGTPFPSLDSWVVDLGAPETPFE